ncbi:hypothetical protein E3U55_06805 [Filobacillus milosensis]|uniref:DUF4367 domain-containing protein n=1 Tax=Filobacillus milosensis TaxID=94137 RepID=A0A4Y8INC2_9BACI|nr:hypothetical protein [Filobacillus milosensis]TFB22945.1 hypothetical protein E3U55_06805 [Filobacillus milosensis]
MKHYNDNELIDQLKNINEKIYLNDNEKRDVLLNINEKIDTQKTRHGGFLAKTLTFAITGLAIMLFMFLVPQFIQHDSSQGSPEETKAIIPENIAEVQQPPFDYMLPSYIPFSVEESNAQYQVFISTIEERKRGISIDYIANDNESIQIHIEESGTDTLENAEVIESDSGRTYKYFENPDTNRQFISFQDGEQTYRVIGELSSETGEYPYTKDELVKIGESFVPFEIPEENNQHSEKSAILPENFDEVQKPNADYKLPSYLPNEIKKSEATVENLEDHKPLYLNQFTVNYYNDIGDKIVMDIRETDAGTIDYGGEKIERPNGNVYEYEKHDSQNHALHFTEQNVAYIVYSVPNLETDSDYNLSKEELIRIMDSLVPVNTQNLSSLQ